MEWTREKTLILIEEYKKRRGLWDMTHEDYRKKDVKKELLDQVSQKFEKAISTVEIEKKFHTLRTQYHREISRMQNQNLKSNQPYKSKWFAFQHLQFLSSPKACRNMKGLKIADKSNKSSQSSASSSSTTRATSSKTITIPVTVTNIKNPDGPPTKIIIKGGGVKMDPDPEQRAIEAAIKCISSHKKSHSDDENDESQCEIMDHDAAEENDDGDCSERLHRSRRSNNSSTNSKTQFEFIDARKQLETLFENTVKNVEEQTESKVIIKEINVPLHALRDSGEHTTTYEITEAPEKIENTHGSEVIVDISEHNEDQMDDSEHCYSGHQQQEHHHHHHQQQNHQHQQQHQNHHHHQQHSELRTIKLPSKKRDLYERLLYEVEDQSPEQVNFEKKNNATANIPRDEYSVYGEYIANELRNITSRDLIIQLKHKINTALYEASLAQLHKEY